ncbi:MAG: hypothetical protein ACRC33_06370, partial [Gemmataceae bacterium]
QQYDYLRQLVEFEDGVVSLPRLYEKAKSDVPALTLKRFHDELLALWDERQIDLHILNEVHRVSDAEFGVRRNDALYYYVFWKNRK